MVGSIINIHDHDVEDHEFADLANQELPPPQMVDVENKNGSRLCCFHDGYDMCDKCADFLDNISKKRSQLKDSKKLRIIADKVISKANGELAVKSSASLKRNGRFYKNEKRSTASSTGGGAWVMDGVQLKTISKTVQQMQHNVRHSGNRVNNGITHNNSGNDIQPLQE